MWDQIKELKELVATAAAVIMGVVILGGFFMEWRIDANIRAMLNKQHTITPEQLEVVTTKLGAIKEDVAKLEGNDSRLENKIDQVIGILLED